MLWGSFFFKYISKCVIFKTFPVFYWSAQIVLPQSHVWKFMVKMYIIFSSFFLRKWPMVSLDKTLIPRLGLVRTLWSCIETFSLGLQPFDPHWSPLYGEKSWNVFLKKRNFFATEERKTWTSWMTWGWVNYQEISILEVNYNYITSAHSIQLSTLLFHMEAGADWDKISGREISHSSRPSHTPTTNSETWTTLLAYLYDHRIKRSKSLVGAVENN